MVQAVAAGTHKERRQAGSQSRSVWDAATSRCFSLSLPLSLKAIKKMSSGEDYKKEEEVSITLNQMVPIPQGFLVGKALAFL